MSDKAQPEERAQAAWLHDGPGQPAAFRTGAILDELLASGPGREATEQALHALRKRFEKIDELAIHYDSLDDTSIGTLHVACSKHGVIAVDMGVSQAAFVERLRSAFDGPIRRVPGLAGTMQQFAAYLGGERESLDLPVDLQAVSEFQRKVLQAAVNVPRGQVATYAEIAVAIGKPRAARAVGQALARNPIPILIPCHRVVAADGSLRGYSGAGGLQTKAQLLRLEGAL